nr:UDP-glycosyltransferase 74E2-like [Ipomoea batatas]
MGLFCCISDPIGLLLLLEWIRVMAGENGMVTREEIERCLVEVMKGERGVMLKENAAKWKQLAKEAVDEGGSSDKNIKEFVSAISM